MRSHVHFQGELSGIDVTLNRRELLPVNGVGGWLASSESADQRGTLIWKLTESEGCRRAGAMDGDLLQNIIARLNRLIRNADRLF